MLSSGTLLTFFRAFLVFYLFFSQEFSGGECFTSLFNNQFSKIFFVRTEISLGWKDTGPKKQDAKDLDLEIWQLVLSFVAVISSLPWCLALVKTGSMANPFLSKAFGGGGQGLNVPVIVKIGEEIHSTLDVPGVKPVGNVVNNNINNTSNELSSPMQQGNPRQTTSMDEFWVTLASKPFGMALTGNFIDDVHNTGSAYRYASFSLFVVYYVSSSQICSCTSCLFHHITGGIKVPKDRQIQSCLVILSWRFAPALEAFMIRGMVRLSFLAVNYASLCRLLFSLFFAVPFLILFFVCDITQNGASCLVLR